MKNLLDIMARLRDPETGCPWDLEQDFHTISPYTIEEAHEVADAIAQGCPEAIRDELGDLLFQVVFHSRLAEERGWFRFDDVVQGVCAKMIRRHPHVFGDEPAGDARSQTDRWEAIKAAERGSSAAGSLLDGIPGGLPPLERSLKLQNRAARAGFDWPDPEPVLDKIREELDELEHEMAGAGGVPDQKRMAEELGDVLFAVTNLARKLALDPGSALRGTNVRFERRFRFMEGRAQGAGRDLAAMDPEALEALWLEAKHRESESSES